MAYSVDVTGSVRLVPMRQLAEALNGNEDWTGLRDRKERRRIQTRLALRSHRKRKAAQKRGIPEHKIQNELQVKMTHMSGSEQKICDESAVSGTFDHIIPAYRDYLGRIFPAQCLFPLSRDHLLPLIEYNLFRGICTNLLILGHSNIIGSPCNFGNSVPLFSSPWKSLESIPATLRPTELQKSASYEAWIDLIPSGKMRENTIRLQEYFSAAELCADLLGGLMGKENAPDSGLIVWKDPWHPNGWELTKGFIRKYSFLVKGCADMYEATNRWRALRGEDPLVLELE